MKSIKCNKSSAVQGLWVYPLEGKCSVQYNDGNIYEYSNVSRRAIFSIVTNDKQSIGKWVNHNCKTKGVTCEWTGHESPWMSEAEVLQVLKEVDEVLLPDFV